MIISISGRISSGKDTTAEIINTLLTTNGKTPFENKKFAGKLKTIASILTGIPVENFEDQEFKKNLLDTEWGTVQNVPLNLITPFADIEFSTLMTVRGFLQKLGTEAMRDGLHKNVWCNALFADYRSPKMSEYNPSNWIITDTRFPNELKAIKDRGGITIVVKRPETDHLSGNHTSETALDSLAFDETIVNDGSLENLIKKVEEVLSRRGII